MAKHQQEDPWAGFVDVLSNILMVVIFLVVILGISIFALSQQITKAAVDKAVRAERESQTQADTSAKQMSAAPTETSHDTAPQGAKGQSGAPTTQHARTDGEKGAAGVYQAAQGLRARQADEIAGDTNLSIRSTKLDSSKSIDVASEEVSPTTGPVEVKSSQAFLTLKFTRGSFKIDDAAAKEMASFLSGATLPDGKIEIRAFAQSTVGSVSEARRIAYYRAMQTRSELIKQGISAGRVELKLRESVSPEELDVVRIYAKPG